jgi:WhiB family redox-sensing transcriptional regulator
MDWRQSAACRDTDPDLFFPIGSGGPSARQEEAAKAVCAGCAVTEECLAWALDIGQTSGVWGGRTEEERRALHRRRERERERGPGPERVRV